jgi:hypothetical protein
VDSTIGVHGVASFVFAFSPETSGMFCTIVTKEGAATRDVVHAHKLLRNMNLQPISNIHLL